MIQHVCLFKFPADLAPAEQSYFDQALENLLASVSEAVETALHRDLGLRPGNPRAFDRCVSISFPTVEAFHAYLGSEPHVVFLEGPVRDSRVEAAALQYTVEKQPPGRPTLEPFLP